MPSDRVPHPAVAAVLDHLVIMPDYTTLTGWKHTKSGPHNDTVSTPVYGDPDPYAARIAAAVLRWAADQLATENKSCEAAGSPAPYPLGDWRVRGMAREIEEQYRTEGEPDAH